MRTESPLKRGGREVGVPGLQFLICVDLPLLKMSIQSYSLHCREQHRERRKAKGWIVADSRAGCF